jgi:hypothetical protein
VKLVHLVGFITKKLNNPLVAVVVVVVTVVVSHYHVLFMLLLQLCISTK